LEKINKMEELDNIFNQLTRVNSDINEHLPTLKEYTEECDTVCEMGVRWLTSTFAFLAGKPKRLTSIDIQHPSEFGQDSIARFDIAKDIASKIDVDFEFILSDSLKIEIEEVDMLFIDTWHAYKQLKAELNLHHSKVKKYIALHDTTNYEFRDETSYEMWGDEWKGDGRGIWPAVEEFLVEHPEWEIKERYLNNNGLTILKRK